jgi:hypothetical protein
VNGICEHGRSEDISENTKKNTIRIREASEKE